MHRQNLAEAQPQTHLSRSSQQAIELFFHILKHPNREHNSPACSQGRVLGFCDRALCVQHCTSAQGVSQLSTPTPQVLLDQEHKWRYAYSLHGHEHDEIFQHEKQPSSSSKNTPSPCPSPPSCTPPHPVLTPPQVPNTLPESSSAWACSST